MARRSYTIQLLQRRIAERQARHFLEERRHQIREVAAARFDPIVVVPFDAELFGHWWFEGPGFLEQFIRQAAIERDFRLSTPSEYLAANPTQQIIEPATSTWGENGYFEVWLNPSNAWIYPQLHIAAQRMSDAARRYASSAVVGHPVRLPGENPPDEAPALQLADRLLKQLARELLLAQSSDWAFLMKTTGNSSGIRNQAHHRSSCSLQPLTRSTRHEYGG